MFTFNTFPFNHLKCTNLYSCILLLTLLLASITFPVNAQNTDRNDQEQIRMLKDTLDNHLRSQAKTGFSGVVKVVYKGTTAIENAYSLDETIASETAFWIGSIAKPIVSTAILKLEEEGKLSTSDFISHFFETPTDKKKITIHQLLTHTSGLPHRYSADGIVDREQAVKAILGLKLLSQPGEKFSYSNDGYSLLAAIIEVASEMTYEDYVQEAVLSPIGMDRSGFWPTPTGDVVIAPIANEPGPDTARQNWGWRGGTGIYSTVNDLYTFIKAFRNGTIISSNGVQRALKSHVKRTESSDIGYGWFVNENVISHSGAESGLNHYNWIYNYSIPDLTIILLSNSDLDVSRDVLDDVIVKSLRLIN